MITNGTPIENQGDEMNCEFCGNNPCTCDRDDDNPVDVDKNTWARIYSNPDYDMDHDHSMDY